jgi:hypothetical protein
MSGRTGGTPRTPADSRAPRGGVAQLGERLVCNQEAIGSIPFTSTIFQPWRRARDFGPGRIAVHVVRGAKRRAPVL